MNGAKDTREEHSDLLPIAVNSVVLDSRDHRALADFYLRMLGWQTKTADEEWIELQSPDGGVKLSFQPDAAYSPPKWPLDPPAQQQMMHIDFTVNSQKQMDEAITHAIACGAVKAKVQYSDHWTVMIDPAGHPFCFVL